MLTGFSLFQLWKKVRGLDKLWVAIILARQENGVGILSGPEDPIAFIKHFTESSLKIMPSSSFVFLVFLHCGGFNDRVVAWGRVVFL